jgi:hypothetical protein
MILRLLCIWLVFYSLLRLLLAFKMLNYQFFKRSCILRNPETACVLYPSLFATLNTVNNEKKSIYGSKAKCVRALAEVSDVTVSYDSASSFHETERRQMRQKSWAQQHKNNWTASINIPSKFKVRENEKIHPIVKFWKEKYSSWKIITGGSQKLNK